MSLTYTAGFQHGIAHALTELAEFIPEVKNSDLWAEHGPEEEEELTDGEVLDRVYSLVEDAHLPEHEKLGYLRQLLQQYRTGGN